MKISTIQNSELSKSVFLVTGANSGLGQATATGLAWSRATVVLLCRNQRLGEIARYNIERTTKNPNVRLIVADLSDVKSVWGAASEFLKTYGRLDLIVNNAAVFRSEREMTADGIERMFATNHLGPFVLTNLLTEVMAKTRNARIVNVAAETTAELDFHNLQGEKDFVPSRAFAATKMCNLLFTFALARKFARQEICANAVDPGPFRSKLMKQASSPSRMISDLFGKTADQAAHTVLLAALAREMAGVNGELFKGEARVAPPPYALVEERQDRLWAESERLSDFGRIRNFGRPAAIAPPVRAGDDVDKSSSDE